MTDPGVFVDTSAIYAVLVANDRAHAKARLRLEALERRRARLVSSSAVLQETVALLQSRSGVEAVRLFDDAVLPVLDIVWISEDLYRRAMAALLAAGRRDVSLTDWTSFEIMRERHLEEAFAFDPHFEDQGFRLLRQDT